MQTIKLLRFIIINALLLYLIVLLYDSYIWVGEISHIHSSDMVDTTSVSYILVVVVVFNTIHFVTEIIKGSD